MLLDLCVLDYIWRGLSLGGATSSLFLLGLVVVPRLMRETSARAIKWFYNIQFATLAGVFVAGFFYLAVFDRDLAIGCFAEYASVQGSVMLTRVLAEVWLIAVVAFLSFDAGRAALMTWWHWRATHPHGTFRVTSRNVGPHVFGLFRPVLVLPEAMLAHDPEILRAIVAHELAHIRDRDALWVLLQQVLSRLLFFHPLVYRCAREYREVMERAADEQAVRHDHIRPSDLMQALLMVAELFREARAPYGLAVTRGFRELKARIEALAQVEVRQKSWSLVLYAAFVFSLLGSMTWAHANTARNLERARRENLMCRQVVQEKLIQSWLQWRQSTNRCEEDVQIK